MIFIIVVVFIARGEVGFMSKIFNDVIYVQRGSFMDMIVKDCIGNKDWTHPPRKYVLESEVLKEIEKLKQENKDMKEILKCIKNDHWFIINLIERYSSNKDLTLKDILERLIFRQPLFRRVFKDE